MSSPNKTELMVGTSPEQRLPVKNEINIQLNHNKADGGAEDNTVFQPETEAPSSTPVEKTVEIPTEEAISAKSADQEESKPEEVVKPITSSTTSSVDESSYEQVERLSIEAENGSPVEGAISKQEPVLSEAVVSKTDKSIEFQSGEDTKPKEEGQAIEENTKEQALSNNEESEPVVEEEKEIVPFYVKYKKEIVAGIIGIVVSFIMLKLKKEN